MGTSIRLVDGVNEFILRPSQPSKNDLFYCSKWDLGWPEPRSIEQDLTGQSGQQDDTYLHGARIASFDLQILDTNGVNRHTILENLKASLAPNKRPYLYIQTDGYTTERRALCRPNASSVAVGRLGAVKLEVSLALKIPTGEFEDVTEQEYPLRPPAGSVVGLSYPITYPITYGVGTLGAVATVPVGGTVNTPPKYLVYGYQFMPSITDADTGLVLSFSANGGLTIPLGSYVEVDVTNGTALMNGSLTNSVYNYLDFSISTWWNLRAAETNRLSVLASAQDASAITYVRFRDRYL